MLHDNRYDMHVDIAMVRMYFLPALTNFKDGPSYVVKVSCWSSLTGCSTSDLSEITLHSDKSRSSTVNSQWSCVTARVLSRPPELL